MLLILETLGIMCVAITSWDIMCVAITCFPVCEIKNFEINLVYLIKSFSYMTKNVRKKV